MTIFLDEILGQPAALSSFVSCPQAPSWAEIAAAAPPGRVVLTGMGASFHAAMWGAHVLNGMGILALAIEASELLYYPSVFSRDADTFVVISQSGGSAELAPLLARLPAGAQVVALTNQPESVLGRHARMTLDLCAGAEATVASKTYLNTLACLWVLAHAWSGAGVEEALSQIAGVAEAVAALTGDAQTIGAQWCERLLACDKLVFTGHGPHVPAARQGAMMLSEWSKRQALGVGIGAFRHGLLEFTDEATGIIILGGAGVTQASVEGLGQEMRSYGATVVGVIEGRLVEPGAVTDRRFPEVLSAMLDVVPMQIFVEQAARQLGVAPGFRHISKVIERL